jgi:hypothetical protein
MFRKRKSQQTRNNWLTLFHYKQDIFPASFATAPTFIPFSGGTLHLCQTFCALTHLLASMHLCGPDKEAK